MDWARILAYVTGTVDQELLARIDAHPTDQRPQIRIDWWAASQVPGFPAPIAAETRAMPSHQRLGSDGRHCLHDRWKPPIQLKEEQAIAVLELDPTAYLALKHHQLPSERSVLSLQPADRPERRKQQPQKEEQQRDHGGRRYVIPSPDQTDEVFGTHRRYCQPSHAVVTARDTAIPVWCK